MNSKDRLDGSTMHTDTPTPAKQSLVGQPWRWLLYVLLLELCLALSLPAQPLTDYPLLAVLVNSVGNYAAVIGKIDATVARHPEAVRLFLAVTLLLIPVKTYAIFSLLNRSRTTYLTHVISPLTGFQSGSIGEFVTEPLREANSPQGQAKPRSMLSRVIWSFLILAFAAGMLWVKLDFGSPTLSGYVEDYRAIGREGVSMWLIWAGKNMLFLSLLLAVAACVIRDYCIYFWRIYLKFTRRQQS